MNNYFFDDQSLIRSSFNKKDNEFMRDVVNKGDYEFNSNASSDTFELNNKKINDLHDEIIELRVKLGTVYDKEQKIIELEMGLKNNKDKDKKINILSKALISLKNDNKELRTELDILKICNLELDNIKQENQLLKQKLKENLIENPKSKDKIKINSNKLKEILYNRLKDHHEKHIETLLETKIDNGLINKGDIEKILIEAIHM
jgi:hypothetical protein